MEPSPSSQPDTASVQPHAASDVEGSASTSTGERTYDPAVLLTLWEGHQTTADLQAIIDASRREAHDLRNKKKTVMREVKKMKKAQSKIRLKTVKLPTQDLLRELEFRASHKEAVARAATGASETRSSTSSSSGQRPKVPLRRGLI